MSLRGLNVYAPDLRRACTYWLALGLPAGPAARSSSCCCASRTGAALQAIRDDEEAAASLGVRTGPLKFGLFVLAGFGCGAAGALTLANTLFIQPQSIFGVQWTAYMIFMVLVGGLGTFEGPILGAVVFFVLQNQFAAVRRLVPDRPGRGRRSRSRCSCRAACGASSSRPRSSCSGRLRCAGRLRPALVC